MCCNKSTSPLARTSALTIESSCAYERTVAFAVVDCQLVNPDLEPLLWKVEHIPANCTFEVEHHFTGEFGIRVSPVGFCGVSYTAQRINRLGTTTVISDTKFSALQIHNPVASSTGNRYDIKVANESQHAVEVTIGIIGCNGSFEPILRCNELASNDVMTAQFPNPKLVAYFVDCSTAPHTALVESGEFASTPLFAPKKSHSRIRLSDKVGGYKFKLF
ncbi:hypothetical protein EXIGLDRAFT_717107 [Exidia glandulosa HHB12029]|uniref:Uncharacterized protein n=1 Tax=Exidia glandulosa HHB12029 TaxID=1314781 RepID=A0A165IJW1_EXIGL|nr:hypothetical protein EXIGLDRAFT_717107 [Exidia glandulosa HHB12029]